MRAKQSGTNALKQDALRILEAAIYAVDPESAVASALNLNGSRLEILSGKRSIKKLELDKFKRIFIVGAGKATAPMAQCMEKMLGTRISGGVISVKEGHGLTLNRTEVLEAAHPVPDQRGVDAAHKISELLQSLTDDDLVFSLISGGGSALMPFPAGKLTLGEKQAVTKMLLACGGDDS